MFLYQHNRNKVLSDRIAEQNRLITETKEVVQQQSTAIESQRTVVDTAIKYSEAFDPEKLENLIRREVEFENKQEIENLKKEKNETLYKAETQHKEKVEEIVEEIVSIALKVSSEAIVKFTMPLASSYVMALMHLNNATRHELIDEIEDELTRKYMKSVILDIEAKVGEKLALTKVSK